MTDRPFAMRRTCAECPWLRSSLPGKFPPSRYEELEATCRPGGLPNIFACHMTPEGEERACAGMLKVCGWDNNRVRIAAIQGRVDLNGIEASGDLYDSFDEMAAANGYPVPQPE